ncbi:MAG: DUF421 domain-containing protein [Bacteroidota bacterium]|jgi:uncharacterized membrane protein YcaP (DUF421 family)
MENLLNMLTDVGFRTTVIYLLLVVGMIILGKRELSQLSIIDLVFILLISNSVQNSMVGENTSLAGGIISGGVLFLLNYILKLLKFRFPMLNKLIQGEPVMLIYEGKLQKNNLDKVKMTEDELMTAIREHGLHGFYEVELAVFETDGNVSVIAVDPNVPARVKKKKLRHTSKV